MILSFFVFLVISLSMFFGLTSYIIGFRNELPNETFQTQKYRAKFDTWFFSDLKDKDNYKSSGISEMAVSAVMDEMKEISGDTNPLTDDQLKDFVNSLVNSTGGVLEEYKNVNMEEFVKIEKIDKTNFTKFIDTLTDEVLEKWQSTNILTYVLDKKFFNTYDEYKGRVSYSWRSPVEDNISATYILDKYVFPKNNKALKSVYDNGVYETKNYKEQDNVFFVSPNLQKDKHYELGKNYDISFSSYNSSKTIVNSLTYGGIASYTTTINMVNHPNKRFYIVGNYNPEKFSNDQNILRECYALSNEHILFGTPKLNLSKKGNIAYWKNISSTSDHPWINKDNENALSWFQIEESWYNTYLIYTAMFSLTVVIDVIMLLLDIIIAWFLIKEIIRSLSKELLFLKTLGMTNNEVSLITSVTLLIILGAAFVLSMVGLLGIQALFINLTSNFVDDICHWTTIQPYSLIAIIGSIVFLFLTYYVSSTLVIRNMNLASNNVTSKSEFRFKKFSRFLFNRNINSGITFSFTVKNLNKIIVTFVIMLLITSLSFIALGFQDSINRNTKQEKKVLLYKDNMSWLDNPNNFYVDGNEIKPAVNYENKSISEADEATNKKDLQGKFMYRDDIDKLLKTSGKKIPESVVNKWKEFCDNYDQKVDLLWPGASKNFTINFGTLFYKGTTPAVSFQLNNYFAENRYSKDRLIIVGKDDARYKMLFKHLKDNYEPNGDKEPTIPVIVSEKNLKNRHLDKGDVSADSNVDFNIVDKKNLGTPMGAFGHLKLKFESADNGLDYVNDVYMRKDDFIKWLTYVKTSLGDNDVYKKFIDDYLINGLINKTFVNSFMDNGMPIGLKQFVIPNVNQKGIPIANNLTAYLLALSQSGLPTSAVDLYKIFRQNINKIINPLVMTMLTVLILSLVLVVSFVIFMIMTIMSENDEIIFIMKALGYSKKEILWRITGGYLVSIIVSEVIGILIASVILNFLSGVFIQILFLRLAIFASGSIFAMFFALLIAMSGFIIGISSYKINKRNLTVREE